jgi:phage minor structural protein
MEERLSMNLLLFDQNERLLANVDAVTTCEHTEDENGNTLIVTGYGIPQTADYCAFRDVDGDLQLFRIMTRAEDKITREISLYAENAYYELLTERPLIDVRPTAVTAGIAATLALAGSRWAVGTVSIGNLTATTRWYYQNRISALADVTEKWGARLKFRVAVSGARITGRYVDVLSAAPVWRGKRFEIGKDVLEAKYTVDRRNVVTAMIGRGKGEETGDGYGPRLDFTGVEWSIAKGNPVNKPKGQDYVEIPAATARYGVHGTRPLYATKIYSNLTDAGELLQATYNDLLAACEPTVSATLTVFDLEAMGLPYEAARYGDEVALIADDIRYKTQIVGVKRDYAARGRDTLQLGAPGSSLCTQIAQLQRSLAETDRKALAGMAVVQANQSLLNGYIDTMVTRIQSSGTNLHTDPADGSLVLESTDGNRAVKLTGNGILIAKSKTGGVWNWTTALDGAGIVASMITSGVLQASLIKILGSEQFYWDAGNIIIQNPQNAKQQIRIGCYDGTHLGIALTVDGGKTWAQAIAFDGVTATELNAATGTFTGELKAATGTFGGKLQTGNWLFDSEGSKFTSGSNYLRMFIENSVAYFKANGYAVEYGSDYTKPVTVKGNSVTLFSTGVNASVSAKKIVDGYEYNDVCFVCDQAGSSADSAAGNLGTSSKIWDIAWLRYIHYFTLKAESSRKVKHDIRPLADYGEALDGLAPVTYVYDNDRTERTRYGLIYEDTLPVLPGICLPPEDKWDTPGIDYVQLVPVLLKEIQQLRKRVAALEGAAR